MENSLDKIINALNETINLTGLDVSDDTILEQAVKIFISNSIQEGKVSRDKTKEDEPTEKQKEILNNYNINPEMLTRKQATQKISEIIKLGRKGDAKKYSNFRK